MSIHPKLPQHISSSSSSYTPTFMPEDEPASTTSSRLSNTVPASIFPRNQLSEHHFFALHNYPSSSESCESKTADNDQYKNQSKLPQHISSSSSSSSSSGLSNTVPASIFPRNQLSEHHFFASQNNPSSSESCESKTADNDQYEKIEKGLNEWCEDAANDPVQHCHRIRAAKEILDCYKARGAFLRLTGITSLPNSIGNLTYLQELDLSGCGLTSIPDSIGNLNKLASLNLSSNRLTSLPNSIGNLKALRYLDLSINRSLTSIPDSIVNLNKLLSLNLSSCGLTSLPDKIGLLEALEEFYLTDNRLQILPDTFENMKALKKLILRNNTISFLPASIGNMKAPLKELDLADNWLKIVPASIGNMKSLKELSLGYNQIGFLPASIGNMKTLQKLGLRSNPISSLPTEIISGLSNSCTIDITGCPFSGSTSEESQKSEEEHKRPDDLKTDF